MSAVWAEFID